MDIWVLWEVYRDGNVKAYTLVRVHTITHYENHIESYRPYLSLLVYVLCECSLLYAQGFL